MYKNAYLKKRAEKLVFKTRRRVNSTAVETTYTPATLGDQKMKPTNGKNGKPLEPIEESKVEVSGGANSNDPDNEDSDGSEAEEQPPFKMTEEEKNLEEEGGESGLCDLPHGEGLKAWVEFIVCFPCRVIFTVTIPDCRQDRWRQWYPLTFAMCIVWIGTLSYIVNWMMTVIGNFKKNSPIFTRILTFF